MNDTILFLLAGASVGFAVGLTGVGGGSLMTPILLLLGIPPHIAVGTDLLFAAITKSGSVVVHARHKTIDWSITRALLKGSIPACLITVTLLKIVFPSAEHYGELLTTSLGFMLLATAAVLLLKTPVAQFRNRALSGFTLNTVKRSWITIGMGALLGVLVTLTSVGAGAVGTAMLLLLYPTMSAVRVIGTDLAHAVPLTLGAGMGHLVLGNVDISLLLTLIMTSLPATWAGAHVSKRMPNKLMQPILIIILLSLGLRYCLM